MYITFQSHYVWRKQLHINKTKTSTTKNGPWVSADVQACIEPPPTPIIKMELEELKPTHITKGDIWRNPSQSTSETCKMSMSNFDDSQPEELITLLRNFRITIDGTVMTSPSGWNNYLRKMLRGASLREFDELSPQGNTTNKHIQHIT